MSENNRDDRGHLTLKAFDLKQFAVLTESAIQELSGPESIDNADADTLSEVGVLLNNQERSGTYVMRNFHAVCATSNTEGLEILPIADALEKYDWLRRDYYWKAVPADKNEFTLEFSKQIYPQGFFIRVEKGAKVEFPYQTALYMAKTDITQAVHNIIIMEEGSHLHLITGCVSSHVVNQGSHFAVTESYIGKNATLINTMVHSWGPKVVVRPHAGTIIEDGGRFESNYVTLRSAGDIKSAPVTWLNGENSSARYNSIVLGDEGSLISTGGTIYLNGKNTSAEIIHRGVCTGGKMNQEGLLIGNNACRAHVDCSGMLVNPGKEGYIESSPGIKGKHPGAELSHEASIGRIAPEQVEYLQSRGIEEQDAISMIIRGFLDTGIKGLGKELDERIAEIADLASQAEG